MNITYEQYHKHRLPKKRIGYGQNCGAGKKKPILLLSNWQKNVRYQLSTLKPLTDITALLDQMLKTRTVGEERMSLGGRIISKQKRRLSLALKEPSQPYASLKNGQKSRFPKP
ncbi:hypothetical protein SAG0121_05645 [Streptococcus agalactiae STIR-CD-07]|nr:hypothetical protein V193_05085 [Streptococcus agalactiae 138P]AHX75065.1 hypothetical protein DN94_05085 [Streptococcus agalactiae]EJZ03416.1 hypothetical protein M3M_04265 [Streptococcus agalactiae STIR-CD-17]EPU03133.1 hypothetical protein SAG0123_02020 [Streptococcus agalactiae STIR-CD-13]EPU04730.1 hypothetical protein SAG0122_06070 [Streptococcus agalactiae STIR-CD-09]EPW84965.1 hypothetical protein SAG0121_05645 [Streptococcus agalactiae STIR-CD-07]CCQ77957.1 hypothetical protein GB